MAITLYKQKTVNKNEKKKVQKNFLKKKIQKKNWGGFFFLQNDEIWPQKESQNSWDHEL